MPEFEHPREYYRIPYPLSARPELFIAGQAYPVIDLSEGGLRYHLGEAPEPDLNSTVKGVIKFKRGEAAGVRGRVIRVQDSHVALALEVSLPFKIILDEQRYLRDNFRGMAW